MLIGVAAAAAVIVLILSLTVGKAPYASPRLEIVVGNSTYGIYDLAEDRTIDIGEGNRCEIKDGVVRMTEADCPDQVCVHTVAIDASGGSIVCLPNHVVLRIVDADTADKEVDTVAE